MNKLKNKILVVLACACAVAPLTGCLLNRTATVTQNASGGFDTNIVTTVNTNTLVLESSAVSVVSAVAVTATLNATHNDPAVIAALKNARVALGGILNGTNPQTTATVIQLLKSQGNPVLAQQVTDLVKSLSAVEQQLLMKYGAGVAGQISVSLTQAVYAGLTVGLAGE